MAQVAFVCETCGTQFAPRETAPESCPICGDERQYVGREGQRWTTLDELRGAHRNEIRDDVGITGIGTEPDVAIGQRALLVPGTGGAFLWDCVPLLDRDLVDRIGSDGLQGIAICHPHYHTSMVEWARTFDCPIYLHEADRQWVMYPDPRIVFWDGEVLEPAEGVTLIRVGGHFAGSTVLHWPQGNALLSGDSVMVAQDRRFVSFMYSYPNLIPLSARQVSRIVEALEPYAFDRIYGAWWGLVVERDGKGALRRSAARYIRALESPAGQLVS